MVKLEGIAKIKGKNVVLENIENETLIRVLFNRVRGDKFNFNKEDNPRKDYQEYSEHADFFYADKIGEEPSRDPSNHTDEIKSKSLNHFYLDNYKNK